MFDLTPFVVYDYVDGQDSYIESGAMVSYDKAIEIGAAYRTNTSISALLGIALGDNFNVYYAYSTGATPEVSGTGANHQFMLRYAFGRL